MSPGVLKIVLSVVAARHAEPSFRFARGVDPKRDVLTTAREARPGHFLPG
jgi:hypothetical protein